MADHLKQLNEIYILYTQKRYSEAFVLVEEVLKAEPQNAYAKRYENLIRPHLNDKSEVGKIATIKGKSLKCVHCQASISLSALNEEQKTKIRNNDYSNLSIKCPYCHTNFTIQKKTKESIIGIQIGDEIFYKNKNYRAVGYVNYKWSWTETYYSGELEYLEWILLGDDNSYLYFSEGYFYDDGEKKYEFEFSEKTTFKFPIAIDNNAVHVWGQYHSTEINSVKATEINGENSKVFTIGEYVKLYNFTYWWEKFVIEAESAWRQSEAWIYKTWSVSQKNACEIFGKEYKSVGESNIFNKILAFGLGGFILSELFHFNIIYLVFWVIGYTILYIFIEQFKSGKLSTNNILIYTFFIFWPILGVIIFFLTQLSIEDKQKINLKDISEWEKFVVEFSHPELTKTIETSRQTYDYGGTRTYYEQTTGLQFSIQDENDKTIIEKIKNGKTGNEKLDIIFSQDIYKYR